MTKKKHAFQVVTVQRTYAIFADNEQTKKEWMTAIEKAIENLTKSDKGGNSASANQNGDVKKDTEIDYKKPEEKQQEKPTDAGAVTKKEDKPKKSQDANISPRTQLSLAKGCIPFLQEEESKVLEFWQIWSESIPSAEDLSSGMSIEFHVFISASMQKLTWRTAGPQNIFIQRMVDFFWNVGAPESEIDRLNDVGALINPVKIGSWIDMSGKGGMDGGWYFPVEIPLSLALEAADPGEPTVKVKEWGAKHGIDKCFSIGRDMGAAPPRQTEMRVKLPGKNQPTKQTNNQTETERNQPIGQTTPKFLS